MSLCNTIATLAHEVEKQLSDISETQLAMLEILKKMPEYKKKKRLDLWDDDYRNVMSETNSFNNRIIDRIWNLGGFNLFGAFEVNKTYQYYQQMVQDL